MTHLFDWIGHQIFQLTGYITGFFSFLFNSLIQYLIYLVTVIINWISYLLSYLGLLFLQVFDYFLQFLVYMLNQIFGGDAFGLVGISTDYIENNLESILTVAPYAKMVGYILNFEALDNAFHFFITFLLIWLFYRWFARWVRG